MEKIDFIVKKYFFGVLISKKIELVIEKTRIFSKKKFDNII